jgi:hypothetical protein
MNEKGGGMWKEEFPVCFIELSQNLAWTAEYPHSINNKKKNNTMINDTIRNPLFLQ